MRARGADLFGERLASTPEEIEAAAPGKFGPGRPKGSRNRTSEDLAQLVQHIGGHPVLAMARVQGMSIAEIGSMLGCNRLEAFDRWWKAVTELAPYVASRMPLALAVKGTVTTLHIGVPMGDGATLVGPDAVLAMFGQAAARAQAEGFQGVTLLESESADETEV